MTKTTQLLESSSSRNTEVHAEFTKGTHELQDGIRISATDYSVQIDPTTSVVVVQGEDKKTLWISTGNLQKKQFIKWANNEIRGGTVIKLSSTEK